MVIEFSKTGNNHIEQGIENQDVILFEENKRFSIISLADGVSTCKKAKAGACIACEAINQLFLKHGEFFREIEMIKRAELTISHINYELKRLMDNQKYHVNDYSSTISSVLYDKKTNECLYFNCGDSAIIGFNEKNIEILFMPMIHMEECCVTTTQYAYKNVQTGIKQNDYDAIMILSDGAWKHLFTLCQLNPKIRSMMENQDFEQIKEYLNKQNTRDDCSFVVMKLGEMK